MPDRRTDDDGTRAAVQEALASLQQMRSIVREKGEQAYCLGYISLYVKVWKVREWLSSKLGVAVVACFVWIELFGTTHTGLLMLLEEYKWGKYAAWGLEALLIATALAMLAHHKSLEHTVERQRKALEAINKMLERLSSLKTEDSPSIDLMFSMLETTEPLMARRPKRRMAKDGRFIFVDDRFVKTAILIAGESHFVTYVCDPRDDKAFCNMRLAKDTGVAAVCAQNAAIIYVPSVKKRHGVKISKGETGWDLSVVKHTNFPSLEEGIRSVLCAPIKLEANVWGVLIVVFKKMNWWSWRRTFHFDTIDKASRFVAARLSIEHDRGKFRG